MTYFYKFRAEQLLVFAKLLLEYMPIFESLLICSKSLYDNRILVHLEKNFDFFSISDEPILKFHVNRVKI